MKIKIKKEQKVYFIGDIHGCYDDLIKSLDKKGIHEDDILVFNGDLINRGDKNLEVLKFIKNRKNTYVVRGNHDAVFINLYYHSMEYLKESFLSMGGTWVFGADKNLLFDYADWLSNCASYYMEIERDGVKIGAVHASVPKEDWNYMVKNSKKYRNEMIWSFNRYNSNKENGDAKNIKGVNYVVFAHVPVENIEVVKNSIYIDTGSYFKNRGKGLISIVEFDEVINLVKSNNALIKSQEL